MANGFKSGGTSIDGDSILLPCYIGNQRDRFAPRHARRNDTGRVAMLRKGASPDNGAGTMEIRQIYLRNPGNFCADLAS
jgi:hypothetical protein